MTKKNELSENKKRPNQTTHQHAMKSPQTQKVLIALRDDWNHLSGEQRGERLNELTGLGCSLRGIGKELGKAESSIRRYIARTGPPKPGGDLATMLESIVGKRLLTQNGKSSHQATNYNLAKMPTEKGGAPIVKETPSGKDHSQSSTTLQTKRITSPASIVAQKPSAASGATSGQENQTREEAPKTSLVDLYNLYKGPMNPDKMQLLARISKQMERPRFRDARSMKLQGRPVPPEDNL